MSTPTIEWLILLTSPCGGSTAAAKLFLTAKGSIALNPNAEGHWLVPAMTDPANRWNPKAILDYDEIRTRWIEEARRRAGETELCGMPPLVIEKSPPNMCRYKSLLSMLRDMPVQLVAMTREPYAVCAGLNFRFGQDQPGRNADEDAYFERLGGSWLTRAGYLEASRLDAVAFIRYEDFADRTSETLDFLSTRIPRLASVVRQAAVEVKDYPRQTIRNLNSQAAGRLTERQREAIRRGLSQNPELVSLHGYALDFEQSYPTVEAAARP